ncbi:MAG: metallophosphoesterase [Terracidiphilus sp.]
MEQNRARGIVRGRRTWFAVMSFFLFAAALPARQAAGAEPSVPMRLSVPVLMVSDVHFDPFMDPSKVEELAQGDISQWSRILDGSKVSNGSRVDTSYQLLKASLDAIRANAAGVRFVTVSGDLLAHDFNTKFYTTCPDSKKCGTLEIFAEKTIDFVLQQLRGALPGVPVYAALGNNDSSCQDYELNRGSDFLEKVGETITADVPAGERPKAESDFTDEGYYSVTLPAPIKDTKLLVLDDIFMSPGYYTCGQKRDSAAAAAQIKWLEQRLDEARAAGNAKVWVMGHIPPDVDAFTTNRNHLNVCAGDKPSMFLWSADLPDAMAQYTDVIRLAIFAHTHMDELRLLPAAKASKSDEPIPVKMVASISPFNGNIPSITIASVDPATAVLKDYRVIEAPNRTGVGGKWSEEYDFAKTYQPELLPTPAEFSPSALEKLIGEFQADPTAQNPPSSIYVDDYSTGRHSRSLAAFWPLYVCSLENYTADGFDKCACSGSR